MIEPQWISRKAVEPLHQKSLAMFGGASGLRDSGLLDSALARPQQVFAYAESPALAAAYAVGITRKHPFVDGNKRSGLLAALLFLDINGYEVVINDAHTTIDAIRIIEGVASGDFSEGRLTEWINLHCLRINVEAT